MCFLIVATFLRENLAVRHILLSPISSAEAPAFKRGEESNVENLFFIVQSGRVYVQLL